MVEQSSPVDYTQLKYLAGFGNHFETESVEGALPKDQNSPQKVPHGLYAEQLSGTPFTYARHRNQRSWTYRIQPTVLHRPFKPVADQERFKNWLTIFDKDDSRLHISPAQYRWRPQTIPTDKQVTFIEGIQTMGGAGGPALKNGLGIHLYACNKSMEKEAFYSSDGDLLIVPQVGEILVKTEFGRIYVEPQEIQFQMSSIIQRGIKFQVELLEGQARGFICEIYKSHFVIPDLGPIGSNGMANPRDFQTPIAWYEDKHEEWTVINKFQGSFFQYQVTHSPFDIVAWHGKSLLQFQ